MNIKRLNEELERLLEEDNVKIGEYTLVPHGENSAKYYQKAVEYFEKNPDKVRSGFVNIPFTDLGVKTDNTNKIVGYEFKKNL